MKIVYQDKEILIEPKKIKTTVKDLLRYLKHKLNSSPEEELILIHKKSEILDKHSCLDECSELDLESIPNSHEYILLNLHQPPLIEEKTKTDSIEKLIMQVTNAKEEIKPTKAQKKRIIYNDENLEYLEQILSGANFPGSSLRLRSEIASLLNNPFLGESSLPSFFSNYGSNNSSSVLSNSNNGTNNNNTVQSNNLPNNTIPVRQRPPAIEPNPVYVQNLVDMGFPEDRAKRALIASRNNLNHATEMILNGYDLDMPESTMYGGNYSQIFGNIHIQIDSNNQNTNENQNMQEENQQLNNEDVNEEEEYEGGADDMY